MAKYAAKGTKLFAEIATVYTKVANVVSIDGPGPEVQYWDATDLDGDLVEDGEPAGVVAPGELSLEVIYDPLDATHLFLVNNNLNPVKVNFKLQYPTASLPERTFIGTVKSLTPNGKSKDGIKANVVIKLASLPTAPAASA